MTTPPERTSETERRRATVLFADITGFTTLNERLDPEVAYEIVTGALKLLDGIARKHGGSVDKYMGDAVMAVFGVPLAMEDAPKAAINAAIEMRNRVKEFNSERKLEWPLDIHSGINTGLMTSGDISGPILREFAVMGDAVNIAARLKDLAPKGEIWVGEESWRYAQRDFEFSPVAPLKLKGKEKTVSVYQVQSRGERLHRRTLDAGTNLWSQLEGRDAEIAELKRRMAELAQEGRGGVIALVGEAGLGKSRLLLEAQTLAEAEGLEWAEGRSLPGGTNLSFHPVRDLLRRWVGIEEKDDDETANAKLAQTLSLLPLDAGEIHPFVAPLMGLRLSGAHRKRVHGIEGDALENLIRRAVGDLLRAAASAAPRVFVMEDMHWADQSSLELVQSVIPLTLRHPVIVIAMMRPGYATTDGFLELARAQCGDRLSELRLEPLSPRASERLIDNLFADGDVPASLRDAIESKATGNPFYIEEVVRGLIDEGALAVREGRLFATGKIHEVRIPGSLQEVVMARVDRLEPRLKRVLQVISVAGENTPHEIVAEIADDARFDDGVGKLVDLQFVDAREREGRRVYRCKHPLIQEVCYEGTLRRTRQELHLRAAQALEAGVPETTPGYAGMLAFHFGRGNDLQAAEEYLFRAGDEAAKVAASSEALSFFREASRLFIELYGEQGNPDKRALLETKIGLAHFHRGQNQEAIEHINRALAFHGIPIPEGRGELVRRVASSAASVLGKLYVPALRGKPQAAGDKEKVLADLVFKRARAQTTNDPLRFLADTIEAMRFVWSVDPKTLPGAAGLNAGAAGLFAYSGFFAQSERFLALAREQLDAGDVSERFLVRFFEFIHHYLVGTPGGIPEIDEDLIEANIRQGELLDVCTYLGVLIKRCVYQGRFGEAAEHIERLQKIEDLYGYEIARENWQGGMAFLALERGEYENAVVAAERYFTENREVLPNILALGTRAKAEVLAGRREDAHATLARARRLVESQSTVPPFHLSAYLRSCLLLALADLGAAKAEGNASAEKTHRKEARKLASGALRAVRAVSAAPRGLSLGRAARRAERQAEPRAAGRCSRDRRGDHAGNEARAGARACRRGTAARRRRRDRGQERGPASRDGACTLHGARPLARRGRARRRGRSVRRARRAEGELVSSL